MSPLHYVIAVGTAFLLTYTMLAFWAWGLKMPGRRYIAVIRLCQQDPTALLFTTLLSSLCVFIFNIVIILLFNLHH